MAKRPESQEQSENNEQQAPPASGIPEYFAAALRIPSSYPLGAPRVDVDSFTELHNSSSVPGIMILNYIPTVGCSTDATSAVNRATFQQFNVIRAQISGSRQYEAADHMIYRMAVDSIRDMYNYAARIYKIMSHYSALNLYKPRAIIEAMGLDFDSWYANRSELYMWLQTNRSSLEPFPTVPIGNITGRRNAYNSVIFMDGEAPTSQMYILNQKAFWSYSVVDQVKGLTPTGFGQTYTDFVHVWNRLYTALQNSTDVYIIAADIRRAFGDQVITSLEAPAVDATIDFVKIDAALTSIMNADIIPVTESGYSAFRVTDKDHMLYCNPNVTIKTAPLAVGLSCYGLPMTTGHINTVESNPDSMAIANATRFKNVYDYVNDENGQRHIVRSMNTEVIVNARIVASTDRYDTESNHTFYSLLIPESSPGDEYLPADKLSKLIKFISDLSCFDWHPPVYMYQGCGVWNDDSKSFELQGALKSLCTVEDVQNYIPITDSNIKTITDASLLYEFGLK